MLRLALIGCGSHSEIAHASAMAWAREAGPLRYIRGQIFRRGRDEEDFLWGTGIHVVDAICHVGGEIVTSDIQRLEHPPGTAPLIYTTMFQALTS